LIARLAHITLAFLLFFSSTGLLMNKHYCQDKLKSVALFAQAKTCQHTKTVPCAVHGTMTVPDNEAKGCCDNESEYLKADTDWVASVLADLDIAAPLSFAATLVPISLETFVAPIPDSDLPYRPPPLRERLARLQSYLC